MKTITQFSMMRGLLIMLALSCTFMVSAQKKVVYVTSDKAMDATATAPENDPIIQMLQADANFEVTVMKVAADADLGDLSGYDVVVAQEGFGSGSAIFQPGNSLALATIPVPFLYNKTYALRNDKAVDANGGTSSEAAGVAITVDPANQTNPLFTGIVFTDNKFDVFNGTAADNGAAGTKALNYTSGITLSDAATLLGTATEITDAAQTIFVNDVPAGTTIGDQVTISRMIAFGMNFGAISADGGNNMTAAGLQLWKNAVYTLAGLEIPIPAVLKHSYTFESDSVKDGVGNVGGTLEGTATIADGSLILDASGDRVVFDGTALDLNSYSSITMEYYFQGSTTANTGWNWTSYFGSAEGANNLRTSLGHWNDEIRVVYTGTEILLDGQDVNDGNVHQIVTVLTADTLLYYEDGTLRASQSVDGFTIGAEYALLGDGYWNDPTWQGKIKEFNIYEGELSANEIAEKAVAFLGQSDPKLQDITLSKGELFPAFSSAITEYSVAIPDGVSSIDLAGVVNFTGATIVGEGTVDVSGTTVDTLEVTSADGEYTKNYIVHFVTVDEDCYMPSITDRANIVPDPEVTDLAEFGGWGAKFLNFDPEKTYCGLTSGKIDGTGSIDVVLTGKLRPNSEYLLKAMVYVEGTGEFQMGAWGVTGTVVQQTTTTGAWEEISFSFTTPETLAGDEGMYFNNYQLSGTLGYIDNWELYNVTTKKVGYINFAKDDMDATASPLDNDPIIQMLNADPYIDLEVQLVAADSAVDFSAYDALVIQEAFGSGSEIYTPSGALALEKIDIPFVYNKIYALRNGKAITDSDAAAVGPSDENAENQSHYYYEVSAENQSNPLFSGITFEADSVRMFDRGAYDNGAALREAGREYFKALQYGTNIDIIGEGDVALTNTLLAVMKGEDNSAATVCVNDIPAGTRIGEQDTLKARMIAISQNTGAINFNMGSNMTDENLTLWRNAVYIAAGMDVPTEGVNNSTDIKSVEASVGTLTLGNENTAQLVLPSGTTTADFTVELMNPNAAIMIPEISVTDGEYASYNVVVKAAIGNDSTIYKLDVHAQSEDEILYVSSNGDGVYSASADYDKNVVDMLTDAGYSVTFAKRTAIFEWTADGIVPFDYTPYKGMVLSGGTGSSNVNDYAKRNYPIPCVTMQNDGPKSNKWGWINDKNAAQFNATKVYDVETAKIKITNVSHYITQDYMEGDLVQWTLGTPDSADWAGKEIKSFNLTDSVSEAIALATIPADGNAHTNLWAIPAGASVRSMNGDYNTYERVTTTSRVVLMSLFNDGLLYASEDLSPLLIRSLEWVLGAEDLVVKKVLYVTSNKDMDDMASPALYDPIIRVMQADAKFDVTAVAVANDAVVDLEGYDVIVVQEGFGSGSQIFTPTGSLALEKIKVPFVYNKTYALRNDKAVSSAASSAGETPGVLYLEVPVANQSNPLFSGITFDGDSIKMFENGAADNGAASGNKALNYTMDLEMTDATTLLAATKGAPDNVSICVNDIPAGTVLGTQDTLQARMIALGMNFGAISRDNGTDITAENLTVWRNAIYVAAGLTPPTELVVVTDPLALDATLSEITANVGEFDKVFDPSVTDYILSVPTGTTFVNVAATATDANATVVGGGNVVTVTGSGSTSFTVTAENGISTKTYNVSITVIDGVDDVAASTIAVVPTVSAEDFEVTATTGSVIEIFDITGQLVSTTVADADKTSVDVPQAGIYMIKVGSSVVKVVKVD